jgi:hypothetical protein
MALGAIRERVDEARHLAIDARPIVYRGTRQSRGMRDGGQMQNQVRRPAESRVNHQRVAHVGIGENSAHGEPARFHLKDGAGGAARHIGPDGVSRRSEGGMRERHAQRLADHLRGSGGAQELASAAGRRASAAQHIGGILQGHLTACEARSGGLHFAGVLAIRRLQGDAAGNQNAGERARGGESHHHRREALVASGHTDYTAARGQGTDQAAEDAGGVVAVSQRVEHAGGALRAAVAGVGAVGGEGDGPERFELPGRGFHEQADFPVAGVVAERDGRAVGRADASVSAEYEDFLAPERGRIPAHTGVLRPSEDVARRFGDEHLGRDGKRPRGAGNFAADVVK